MRIDWGQRGWDLQALGGGSVRLRQAVRLVLPRILDRVHFLSLTYTLYTFYNSWPYLLNHIQ